MSKQMLLLGRMVRLLSVIMGFLFVYNMKAMPVYADETLVDAWKRQMQESSGASDKEKYNQAPQLSVDDICEMNQGNAVFLITNRAM